MPMKNTLQDNELFSTRKLYQGVSIMMNTVYDPFTNITVIIKCWLLNSITDVPNILVKS